MNKKTVTNSNRSKRQKASAAIISIVFCVFGTLAYSYASSENITLASESSNHVESTLSNDRHNDSIDDTREQDAWRADAPVTTQISFVDPGYDNYGIICSDNEMIPGGKPYNFLSNVSTIPAASDTRDGDEFGIIVAGIDGESGCSYTYKTGDTSFTPSKNDDGKKYTVHYQLRYRGTSSEQNWVDVPGATANRVLTVYTVNETIDELGDDQAFVKTANESGRSDGSSPWDGDDDPGDDSSDNNGIVRTYDTAMWNISYTTASHDIGTSYSNAWIKFEFDIPYDSTEVAFDTDAMSWMSTDPQHKWSISATSLGGKSMQTLTCWKRLTNQGSSTSAVPGSGEIYLTLRAYSAKNGDVLSPMVRISLPGDASTGTKCPTHVIEESKQIQLSAITISAAPNYNLFWESGGYSQELSSTFDFSTGSSSAPNKQAGKIHGRCMKMSLCLELRNKTIKSGADKGKDKKLKGIEMPSGDITYDIDLSSVYLGDNGKEYALSNKSQYTPLVYDIAANGVLGIYQRDRQGMFSSVTSAPISMEKHQKKDGLYKSETYTGYTWNSGTYQCSQLGNKATVTISNYEINPIWYPNSSYWGSDSKKYYDWELGVLSTSRGIFTSSVMYVVVPYGNGDDYLPMKYGTNGTMRLLMDNSNLMTKTVSGSKLAKVSDNSNQSVTNDDSLQLAVYLTRPGTYSNTAFFSWKEQPFWWRGSCGPDDGYNCSHGSDQLALGDSIGVYFGTCNMANGEKKNIMQAHDLLIKFDDKALSVKDPKKYYGGSGKRLFACKKDGSGWADDDEMQSTNIEDLFYYDNYDKLLADGKICVGILDSYRNQQSVASGQDDQYAAIVLQATNDISMNGHVAQLVVESNAWYLYTENSDGTLTKNADVPTRLDVQSGKASEDDYHSDYQYIKNLKQHYVKAEYDAGGNFHEHTSGYNIGDSVRLVSYKSHVNILAAQHDESGNSKNIYDLDNNQYTVDYEIKPTTEIIPGTNISLRSTLLLKATIPAGMEYIPDSSYFGGEYIQSSPVGYHGKNTGIQVTPNITKDSTGSTTIFWQITDVDIKETMPSLFFSCKMDSMTKRNTDFQVSASVQTTEDKRPISSNNYNFSTYSIKTSRTTDISIKTSVAQSMNDLNSSLAWNLSWSNNSTNNLSDQVMLVIMPSNTDTAGSNYSGTYSVSKITINNVNSKTDEYDIWYTTDPDGTSLSTEDGSGITSDTIRSGKTVNVSWAKANINQNGEVTGLPNNGVTAWCVIGTIPGAGSIDVSMIVTPDGNKSGDRYVNTIWLTNSTTQASAYIVRRVISGCTWIDYNANGKRDTNEKFLAGIRVTLVDASTGDMINNLDGIPCTIVTGSDGTYRFDKLPAGDMKVRFDDAGAGFDKYRQSEAHVAGLDDSVNDDAVGSYNNDGVLLSGLTDNLVMPATRDIISTPYIMQNIDAGYTPRITLPLTGLPGAKRYAGLATLLMFCSSLAATAFYIGLVSKRTRKYEQRTRTH